MWNLLLVHWPNAEIPLRETMAALAKAKRQKLTRHVGVANFNIALLDQAIALCPSRSSRCKPNFIPTWIRVRCLPPARRAASSSPPIVRSAVAASSRSRARRDRAALRQDRRPGGAALADPEGKRCADPAIVEPTAHCRQYQVFDFTLSGDDMVRIDALKRPNGRNRQSSRPRAAVGCVRRDHNAKETLPGGPLRCRIEGYGTSLRRFHTKKCQPCNFGAKSPDRIRGEIVSETNMDRAVLLMAGKLGHTANANFPLWPPCPMGGLTITLLVGPFAFYADRCPAETTPRPKSLDQQLDHKPASAAGRDANELFEPNHPPDRASEYRREQSENPPVERIRHHAAPDRIGECALARRQSGGSW